ncbi:InlB B-repeat-containing protein, partial [Pontibacter sp. HSC-36F09]|uniref:InlB B-repeat-containing protein n=1 Tax=Pontibacter sp. HSC-36F09 TaxID=2910966 RepID=UPI00209FB430
MTSIQIVPGTVGGGFSLSANVKMENGTTRNGFRTITMPYAEAGPDVQLSCASPSVTIGNPNFQNNVTWRWAGPNGYTSTVKNPVVSFPGTYVLTVTGGSCTYTDEVTVSAPTENCPPVLNPITNRTVNELANLPSTILTASDANGDAIAYSFRHAVDGGEFEDGLPTGAAFNTTTRALTWRPSEEQGPGIFTIEATVSDDQDSDTKTFTITVNEVNSAPVYSPIPTHTYGIVGQKIEFPVSATDPDVPGTPTITLSLSGTNGVYPAGATITNTPPSANPQTGLFSWTPAANQVGRAAVYALANDGSRGLASPTFYLYVNAAPNLNPITAKSVEAGKLLTFQLSGSDVNSSSDMFTSPHQTRAFSVEVTPVTVQEDYPSDDVPAITKIAGDWTGNQNITGANTSAITGVFAWTPTTPGTYTVKIKLQDSGISGNVPLADEESFTVTVTTPPVTMYALTITQPENGSIAAEPSAATYEAGTVVTLTATPAASFQFAGWSGDTSGSENPVELTMDGDKAVSATFEPIPTYTLTISEPSNGTIGINPTADQDGKYNDGTVVTLTAIPAAGYQFTGWMGAASGIVNPLQLVMDADKNVSATFELIPPTTYTLTLNDPENGSIVVDPEADTYVAGTVVTLTATPADGFRFTGWSGDASGSDSPLELTMDGNKTVSAIFEAIPPTMYALTITQPQNGSIAAEPSAATYVAGSVVTLTATPADGYQFVGWTGDASGSELTVSITMDADKAVSATFEVIPPTMYALTLNQPENGTISADPSAPSYEAGTVVTLTATPASGYRFTGWTGDASGNVLTETVTMDADKQVSATFELIPPTMYALTITQPANGSITAQPAAATYVAGTVVTLTATPADGFRFVSWGGAATGTEPNTTVTMDQDKTVSATIEALPTGPLVSSFTLVSAHTEQDFFQLTDGASIVLSQLSSTKLNIRANTSPSQVGSVKIELTGTQFRTYTDNAAPYALFGDDGRGNYYYGNWNPPATGTYTLRATPYSGSNGTGTAGTPLTITFTVVNNVSPGTQYALSVSTMGGGTVAKSPDQDSYAAGSTVTLTATPQAGFQFAGWSGDASGSANPLSVTMDRSKVVTATFTATGSGPQVSSFTLVSAHTEQDFFQLTDGASIVLSQLSS